MECSQALFGPFDMPGIPCFDDGDCLYGATCDPVNSICEHTNEHVLTCLLEKIDPVVAQSLFHLWGIPEEVSEDRMKQELEERFIKELCVGPGSLNFR
jgi:hypothetical protein